MKIRYGPLLLLCGLAALFLAESGSVRAAVGEGLTLCAATVVPSLFPFLVVSALLTSCGFGPWAARWAAPFMALYRLPGCAASAVVLGLAGGYPIGAKTAADLCRQGLMTREEGERLLTFCSNSGPVFLIGVLGGGIFQSTRAGLWLWLVHIASALVTGLFFRDLGKGRSERPPALALQAVHLPSAFVAAVREGAAACLSVCGFVTWFYLLSRPLAGLGGWLGALLTGGVELFSLTPLLGNDGPSFILSSACAAWGGLSVLCQTAAVLEGSGLDIRWYVLGKGVQALLSALLAALVWAIL